MENATSTYIELKEHAGNPPPVLNAIQKLLLPHVEFLTVVWITLWIMTALVLLSKLWDEYREQRK